ncbi:hypothetical protein [Pseudorhodobacter wandonensis]|uniref:hypothetical protein n=1 Tax=Pseudorhodobacter wandonensis TaxID=1120568 RepID=UPI000AA10A1D|nr:hypothetical protein [Pseudorhodobacter wandonensis]
MRISVFSAKPYDIASLGKANDDRTAPHDLVFLEPHLSAHTAVLPKGQMPFALLSMTRLMPPRWRHWPIRMCGSS